MVSWLSPRRSAITFDLGESGIRAYQFRQRGSQPRLCDALCLDRAPTPTPDAPEQDRDKHVAAPRVDPGQLSRLIGQGRFAGRDVGLVLSPPHVRFFPLRLPAQALDQPAARVIQALKWEVARESREAAENLELRYWRLPAAAGQQANVMAVSMSSSLANNWCSMFERHHLALRRIDVSPCALVRLARRLWTAAENDLWGVLDLGLRQSTLTVVAETIPVYIRSVSACAQDWTEKLAQAFEVSYSVAEQLKREHGVQQSPRGLGAPASGRNPLSAPDLSHAVSSVLRESLQTLPREIERCFAYVMQGFPEHTVRGLLLAGGGAALAGLPELLESELGVSVTSLTSSTAADAPQWEHPLPDVHCEPNVAAAVGGALLSLEAS